MRMVFYIITILGCIPAIHSDVMFTNLKCGIMDRKFASFKKCYIKAVNRTHKYIDVHVNLYQTPIDNVTVHAKLMRHDNHGYKPFFIDVTFDGCKFLKNQRQPIVKMLYEMYKNSSNVNHTCPYDHDIILDHLWTGNIEMDIAKYIPMLNGDYAVFSEWSTYNIARAFFNVYIRVSNRQN
ncbi:uncharacterized protein LOC108113888 [Drosophila eugracilis]|uniref:uncharacterized protein LOC108113888 n=1 Tax=Drosophila eugracilis TaxID=29029 RepID=UPI0007E65DD6|nr:uncharacterized protein LOC108113888 [Drosophila eugracilis]